MYQNLALFAAFLLLYSLFAGGIETRLLNGPLMFMLVGLILGPAFLGVLAPRIDKDGLKILAELTLAIVLFSDCGQCRPEDSQSPRRIAHALADDRAAPDDPQWLAGRSLAVSADTVGGTGSHGDPAGPHRRGPGQGGGEQSQGSPAPVREGLNVESGLNDGICVPVLLMFLALLIEEQTRSPLSLAAELFVEELGIGAVVGLALTFIAWLMFRYASKQDWQSPIWSQLTLPGLALLCFATAQTLGGSGFIAAFVGGLLASSLFSEQKHRLLESSEEFATPLSVITWIVFGALVIPRVWGNLTPAIWLYAVLSLTVIRVLPVLIMPGRHGLRLRNAIVHRLVRPTRTGHHRLCHHDPGLPAGGHTHDRRHRSLHGSTQRGTARLECQSMGLAAGPSRALIDLYNFAPRLQAYLYRIS